MRSESDSGNTRGNSEGPGAGLQRAGLAHAWLPPLPRRLSHQEPVYTAAAEGLLADKGGLEAVTTAELMLIADTVEAFVVGRMIGRRIFRRGVTRKVKGNGQGPREELAPAIAAYFTAKNTVRLGLQALGLDRRAHDVTLDAYLAKHRGTHGEDRAPADPTPSPDGDRASGPDARGAEVSASVKETS